MKLSLVSLSRLLYFKKRKRQSKFFFFFLKSFLFFFYIKNIYIVKIVFYLNNDLFIYWSIIFSKYISVKLVSRLLKKSTKKTTFSPYFLNFGFLPTLTSFYFFFKYLWSICFLNSMMLWKLNMNFIETFF